VFGTELTEKFILVFGGTTIHVPSTREIEEESRNVSIYSTLKNAKSIQQSKRLGQALCEQYDLDRTEMRDIFKDTKRKLREAKRVIDSDKRVSVHMPKKIKVRRKSRRRM
jgi:hypothetical protein